MKAGTRSNVLAALGFGSIVSLVIAFAFGPLFSSPMSSLFAHKQDVRENRVQILVATDGRFEVRQAMRARQSARAGGREFRDRIAVPGAVQLDGLEVTDLGGTEDPEIGDASPTDRDARGSLYSDLLPAPGGFDLSWDLGNSGLGQEAKLDVRYRVTGAADAYDDVVFVRWQLWGDAWSFPLRRLQGTIGMAVPGGPAPLRTWVGPADIRAGVKTVDGRSTVQVKNLAARHGVTIGALFPRDAFDRELEGAVVHRGDGRAAIVAREDRRAAADPGARRAGWVADHQLLLLALVLAAMIAGVSVLSRFGEEPTDPGGLQLTGPPEAGVAPAVAGYLATLRRHRTWPVLPTLLGLVDRGFYTASVEAAPSPVLAKRADTAGPAAGSAAGPDPGSRPGEEPSSRDLVLGIPADRPTTDGLSASDAAVLAFYDALVGETPGPLAQLHERAPEHDEAARARWDAATDALCRTGPDEVHWAGDLRPWQALLLTAGVGALVAIGVLASARIDSLWLVWSVAPLVIAVGLAPSQETLRHLEPESLSRHHGWHAFAEWTRRPALQAPPSRRRPEDWGRVLPYVLVFGNLRAVAETGRLPDGGDGPGSWWAGLADRPLAFLAENDLGRTYERRVERHLADHSGY